MSVAQMLLPELDNEMKTTRRVLERVPEDKLDWQPHGKSMTMGRLASHLAELAGWGEYTLANDSLDLSPPGAPPFKAFDSRSRQEILDTFDANVQKTRAALERATDDAAFATPWTLQFGERLIFTMPRGAVLRTMLFNHIVHHRGQLSVYLRLNDVPVPSIYGPSADEQ